MFSTLYNIIWLLFNLVWFALWTLKVIWKLGLIVYFCYGALNLTFLIHKLCKYVAEEHQKHRNHHNHHLYSEKHDNHHRSSDHAMVRDTPSHGSLLDTASIYSDFSSRRSSEEFVVTSWDSCQVRTHHGIMGRRFQDGGLLRYRKWVPQQLGDVIVVTNSPPIGHMRSQLTNHQVGIV